MNREPRSLPNPDGGPEPDPELERFLVQNRFRHPPEEWREAILAKALAPALEEPGMSRMPVEVEHTEPTRANGSGHIRTGTLADVGAERRVRWWDAWRSGWTVLAGAWGLVWCLNYYAAPHPNSPVPQRPPWSDRALAEIRAQQSLLADISEFGVGVPREGRSRSTERSHPPVVDRPRAERRQQQRGGMV